MLGCDLCTGEYGIEKDTSGLCVCGTLTRCHGLRLGAGSKRARNHVSRTRRNQIFFSQLRKHFPPSAQELWHETEVLNSTVNIYLSTVLSTQSCRLWFFMTGVRISVEGGARHWFLTRFWSLEAEPPLKLIRITTSIWHQSESGRLDDCPRVNDCGSLN